MDRTIELTKDNFQKIIDENDVVFVDFWASWCGPCMQFKPVFEEASGNFENAVFGKVNTEEQPELAAAFGIRSIPTLMAFREKVMLFNQPGALPPPVFNKLVNQVLDIDMEEVHAKIAEQEAAEGKPEDASN